MAELDAIIGAPFRGARANRPVRPRSKRSSDALKRGIVEGDDVVVQFIECRVAVKPVNRVHRSQTANQGRLIHTEHAVETKAMVP